MSGPTAYAQPPGRSSTSSESVRGCRWRRKSRPLWRRKKDHFDHKWKFPFRPARRSQGSCNDLQGLALTPSLQVGIQSRKASSKWSAILVPFFAATDTWHLSVRELLARPRVCALCPHGATHCASFFHPATMNQYCFGGNLIPFCRSAPTSVGSSDRTRRSPARRDQPYNWTG